MGPNYEPGTKKDLATKAVQRTVLCMGRRQVCCECLHGRLLKSAAAPLLHSMAQTAPKLFAVVQPTQD